MPAGSSRGIYSWSHGRCQPLHHPCKKGHNYAQRHSVSLPHLWRASTILSCSSQTYLLVVGCVGFLFVNWYRRRELKWENAAFNYLGFVSFYPFFPILSHLFFHPAQVSWSDVLVLSLVSFFCLAQVSQCNDFYFLYYYFLASSKWLQNFDIWTVEFFINYMLSVANSECTLWNVCHKCSVWHWGHIRLFEPSQARPDVYCILSQSSQMFHWTSKLFLKLRPEGAYIILWCTMCYISTVIRLELLFY